ncbi:MAG: Co2+/Mg2+ efflux protein ApaG [Alphaproteobacteria bacterium]|nr:Co2+/Mg2+ efflux protein ApaG [Alphaproteobacteria bacterium]
MKDSETGSPSARDAGGAYAKTTRAITVSVQPSFLADQSSPEDGRFVWAYHVRIENQSNRTVRLINRYWRITDAQGRTQEVRGAGVVGKQPRLNPGGTFEYTSGTPLATPSGFMSGSYQMKDEDGGLFEIEVPAFSLDSPHHPARLN